MAESLRLSLSQSTETRILPAPVETYSILAGAVEAFVLAWEQGQSPPEIARLLPEPSEVRRLTLIELVKVDLEYRWKDNFEPRPLSDYVREFPELGQPWIPADLIYEEFHQRKLAGLVDDPREYLARYPEQSERLKVLLGLHEDYRSTRLVSTPKVDGLDCVKVGDRLHDIELLVELGRGAFARVFLARQTSMQRLLAVKVSADQGDEPKTLAHLDHDSIVRVYDVFSMPNGLRLLLMQYLPGGTLEALVERFLKSPPEQRTGQLVISTVDAALTAHGEGRGGSSANRQLLAHLTWPETVAWLGMKLATALDVAHHSGVLHRDVKPANVLLSSDCVPKLADFNTSFSAQVQGATPAAWFGGSLAYMAPEQLEACANFEGRRPDDLDGRCDLYSLGILLWEVLTGVRPMSTNVVAGGWGPNVLSMIARRCEGLTQEEFSKVPADCPPALLRVLVRCLEPAADRRWQTGKALSRQLELCLDPHARSLTDPPARSWIPWVRRNLVWLVVLINLIPNIVAAVANYQYNRWRIVEFLENAVGKFDLIQGIINGIAFPTGIGLMVWLAWRVRGTLFRGLHDEPLSTSRRVECLRLGERCAGVCLVLWMIAGLAYPIAMAALSVSLPWTVYGHFFISLLICGLIATAYPYLGATFLCLRAAYPAMIASGEGNAQDLKELQRLDRGVGWALFVAGAVPLVAICGLTLVPGGDSGQALLTNHDLWLLRSLCLGGIAGLGLVWRIAQWLRTDLEALTRLVS